MCEDEEGLYKCNSGLMRMEMRSVCGKAVCVRTRRGCVPVTVG